MAKLSQDKWVDKKGGKKRKCVWKVDYLDPQGKRRRKFFDLRENALDFYRIVENREERIKNRLGWVEAISYEDALPLYKAEYLALKSKTHCARTYRRLLYLKGFFKGKPLCDVIPHDIGHLIRTRLGDGLSNKAVNEDRSDLQSLFRWATKRGFAAENPVEETERLPKSPREVRRAYSQKEIQNLLLHACHCCFPAIAILANTGIRLGELDNLKLDDFDIERQVLFITHSEATPVKGKKSRVVPLNDYLIGLVSKFPEGKVLKMPRSTFEKHFRRVRERAGVPDAIPHGLRHSYTSHLVESGMDLNKVQRITGHEDIKTLSRYLHSTGSDLIPYRNSVSFGVPYECREGMSERTKTDNLRLYGQNEEIEKYLENRKLNDVIAKMQKMKKVEAGGIAPPSGKLR